MFPNIVIFFAAETLARQEFTSLELEPDTASIRRAALLGAIIASPIGLILAQRTARDAAEAAAAAAASKSVTGRQPSPKS
jgi:hypothetical protein